MLVFIAQLTHSIIAALLGHAPAQIIIAIKLVGVIVVIYEVAAEIARLPMSDEIVKVMTCGHERN